MSLDELERRSFAPGPAPTELPEHPVRLREGAAEPPATVALSLNGTWSFLEQEQEPAVDDWENAFPGEIPCTVHMALWKAGKIPDPVVGQNQVIAREHSFRTWWLRRTFSFSPKAGETYRLSFSGVADRCTVWLNGTEICRHQGMFGGPDADVTGLLSMENELVVKLEPIGFRRREGVIPDNNDAWTDTVVFNNVYGWHYFNMPTLGIWQPVTLWSVPKAELARPFVFTKDHESGAVGLVAELTASSAGEAEICVEVAPRSFTGKRWAFSEKRPVSAGTQSIRYDFNVPEHRLWWPNGWGEQNLYDVTVSAVMEGTASVQHCLLGIRTLRMDPLPGGPDEKTYNWAFVVNGRKIFIKGTNWCTVDAMLDLSPARYTRYLSMAKRQHMTLLRAWGSGMPETDTFYELCSEYGLLVMQEWPTAWNSHLTQPMDVMEETIRRNTCRIRSYPALAMYGAGNESDEPFGEMIDMMGRLSVELDGTRPFHRGEPYGGSLHDYGSWWGFRHIDHHLTAEAPFWGEFGFASMPSRETFLRYMPKESREIFPLDQNDDFLMHTPTFRYQSDLVHIMESAHYFLPKNYKWEELRISSQFAQALGVRRVIDRSRARNPQCSGVVYYKMNDNSPAISWSCVDYYGFPKLSYYVFQDSFAPQCAVVLFDRLGFQGTPVRLPVYLLDETDSLPDSSWKVTVRAYGADLREIQSRSFETRAARGESTLLGRFELSPEETENTPLLIVCDLTVDGKRIARNFYFSNMEQERGCLFRLPRAGVRLTSSGDSVTLENVGKVPAVGVMLTAPKDSVAVYGDNFLWLEPGETETVAVSGIDPEEVEMEGLNLL